MDKVAFTLLLLCSALNSVVNKMQGLRAGGENLLGKVLTMQA